MITLPRYCRNLDEISAARTDFEALKKSLLRNLRRPRRQSIQVRCQGCWQIWQAEKLLGFRQGKTRQARRFKVRGDAIGIFDGARERLRQLPGQTKTAVDGGEQTVLKSLIIKAYCSFERTDQIADHIFCRVVQKRREMFGFSKIWVERACDVFDNKGVLRDRKCVVANGLTIPARDAGKTVRDVFDLDIVRRRRQQIEAAA